MSSAGRATLVGSFENTPYMSWQARLFAFSVATRVGSGALVVVHDAPGAAEDSPLEEAFLDLDRLGATVVRAPSFYGAISYPARNKPGSLLVASRVVPADEGRLLVLCDGDFVFTRAPELPAVLGAQYYWFMDYELPYVRSAAERMHLSPDRVVERQEALRLGSPHVVPHELAERVARAWLAAIDAFLPGDQWEREMYAFGLALERLGLEAVTFDDMQITWGNPPTEATVVHYGGGDSYWQKRDYVSREQAARVWWPPEFEPGTLAWEIGRQLEECRRFFGLPDRPPSPVASRRAPLSCC